MFATSDHFSMAIAKSLLQSAEIPFVVEGGGLQDVWGFATLGREQPAGTAALRVAQQDAAAAQALLVDVTGGRGGAPDEDERHS